ncbi:MAG: O-antigen ligase family protein [Aliarcobacter sp.]|jgi:O-antigen ligase|nr:O-antigen ligase family protein [Aliarcobacter sp.]
MINFFNPKNIFNVLLLVWVISIPFKNAIYQGSTIFLIIFFLVYVIKNRDYDNLKILFYKYKDLFIAFSLIILSMTISNILNDVSKTDAWHLEFSYIYRYAFIFIVLIYFYSKDFFSKQMLIIFIFISLGIQGLDGVFQSITGYDIFKHNIGDLTLGLSGATFNRNIFGFFMGIGILFSFFLIKKDEILSKFNSIFLSFFIIFIFSTLFSFSRAAWVSVFISFVLYFILNYKKINIKHIIGVSMISIFLIVIFLNIDLLQNRFEQLLNGQTSRRDTIWINTIYLIKQKLFFGWGVDTWQIYGLKEFAGIHNITLEILFYMGFFGLFSFLIFLGLIIKEIFSIKNYELLSFIIFMLIVGQFDHSIITGKTYLATMTILMFFVFMNRIDNKEISK